MPIVGALTLRVISIARSLATPSTTNGESPGFVRGERLVEHALAFGRRAALGFKAAVDIRRLRPQADMADDRNAAADEEADVLEMPSDASTFTA